jgi:hypothetical protein
MYSVYATSRSSFGTKIGTVVGHGHTVSYQVMVQPFSPPEHELEHAFCVHLCLPALPRLLSAAACLPQLNLVFRAILWEWSRKTTTDDHKQSNHALHTHERSVNARTHRQRLASHLRTNFLTTVRPLSTTLRWPLALHLPEFAS